MIRWCQKKNSLCSYSNDWAACNSNHSKRKKRSERCYVGTINASVSSWVGKAGCLLRDVDVCVCMQWSHSEEQEGAISEHAHHLG